METTNFHGGNALTSGSYCYYCGRWYTVIKKRRVPAITIDQYESELGSSPEKLEKHGHIVVQIALNCIKRGLVSPQLNWSDIETQAAKMSLEKKNKLRKKRPGFSHMPMAHYTAQERDLNANGKKAFGHRLYILDGVLGVLTPDAPVTRIELEEEIAISTAKGAAMHSQLIGG